MNLIDNKTEIHNKRTITQIQKIIFVTLFLLLNAFMNFQKINEQKLQAFAIGAMGKRPLSKKEQEDRRKREEETAAAHVSLSSIFRFSTFKKIHLYSFRHSRSSWRLFKRRHQPYQKYGSKAKRSIPVQGVSNSVIQLNSAYLTEFYEYRRGSPGKGKAVQAHRQDRR